MSVVAASRTGLPLISACHMLLLHLHHVASGSAVEPGCANSAGSPQGSVQRPPCPPRDPAHPAPAPVGPSQLPEQGGATQRSPCTEPQCGWNPTGNRSKVSLAHGATHSESSSHSGTRHHPTGAGGGGAGGFQTVVETGTGPHLQAWAGAAGTGWHPVHLDRTQSRSGVGGVCRPRAWPVCSQGSGMELSPARRLLSRARVRTRALRETSEFAPARAHARGDSASDSTSLLVSLSVTGGSGVNGTAGSLWCE